MEIRRLRTSALETFKTLNHLNPAFMTVFLKKERYQRKGKTTWRYLTETLLNKEIRL